MKPLLKVIDNPAGIEELKNYLADKEYIAFDCETTGLTRYDEVIGFSVCAEESCAFYVILAKWDFATIASTEKELIYLPKAKEDSAELLNTLKGRSLIMHNGIFDCTMIEAYFKISLIQDLHTDTMVLAHLLNENRLVGLKPLGKEYFGQDAADEAAKMKASVIANGGTTTKSDYQMYKSDAYLMGMYGAQDALLTFKLFNALIPELYEQELDKFFYEEESMPLLRTSTYELNTTGLQVDVKGLASLKKTLEAECLEAKAFIYQEIGVHIKTKYPGTNKKNGFNIGSTSQLSWLLFGVLELEFGTLTDGGKEIARGLGMKNPYTAPAKREFIATIARQKNMIIKPASIFNGRKKSATKLRDPWNYIACDKKTLAKHAHRYKWIEKLLEYQKKTKLLNTYVEGIEERTKYGIIQPSFLQTGTTSGRYSSRNPNFQNMPRDDKRIKAAIVARPGKVFVGADYSQLEPRVFAYVSQDKSLMAAFDGTDDFYSVIGMRVYGKYDCTPQKEGSPEAFGVKYKKLRDLSKVIALASTYGATAHQLAPTTGKSIDQTAQDIEAYFEEFPDVAKMMTDSHELAKKDGQVKTVFGRPRRIPDAKLIPKHYGNATHADLPYEMRSLLNLSVNHRIQGTGASIVNRAMVRFHNLCKEAQIDCKLVCQVHDSLIAECNQEDSENVALLLQEAMENTTILPGVKLEAVPKIGKNFAEV